jgi:glutaminyl-tRNA synthetase
MSDSKTVSENTGENKTPANFIHAMIEEDIRNGKNGGRVHTRFPPEPNGYLHIGHAKSICLNFGTALKYNGKCNLRFDDTNPVKEDVEYVDSIRYDVHWLGFDWRDVSFTPPIISRCCMNLPKADSEREGLCMRPDGRTDCRTERNAYPSGSGKPLPQPHTGRKSGPFPQNESRRIPRRQPGTPGQNRYGFAQYAHARSHSLPHHPHRASPHRKPVVHLSHVRLSHGQSDSIEGITHSICTLEFEVHRPLYDWCIRELEIFAPQQIEFARLNVTYTVMSKRKLLELVKNNYVSGWDDPRMPTISGLRRRGYTPESIRNFSDLVGVAKRENVIDVGLLEFCIREDLNKKAQRVMGVLNPVKLIIDNYPEGLTEEMPAVNNPEDPEAGTRKVPFTRELYIEREDFMEDPPSKFFRLAPGREVRLKYAYIIKCESVVKDPVSGEITEIHCTYDPETLSGRPESNRKVKGTLHWVSAAHAVEAEIRLYDRLFMSEDPEDVPEGEDYKKNLNPDSLKVIRGYVEPFAANTKPLDKFQFERLGYFCADSDTTAAKPVFNRTVALKDSWAKAKS